MPPRSPAAAMPRDANMLSCTGPEDGFPDRRKAISMPGMSALYITLENNEPQLGMIAGRDNGPNFLIL